MINLSSARQRLIHHTSLRKKLRQISVYAVSTDYIESD